MTLNRNYRIHVPAVARIVSARATRIDDMQPVTVNVTGDPGQVRAVLRTHKDRGTLIDYGIPRWGRDGRVTVEMTLLQPAPGFPPARRRWTRKGIAIAAAVVVAVGLLGLVAYAVADLIVTSMTAIVGAAVVVLLLLAGATVVGSRCRGLHCEGCP